MKSTIPYFFGLLVLFLACQTDSSTHHSTDFIVVKTANLSNVSINDRLKLNDLNMTHTINDTIFAKKYLEQALVSIDERKYTDALKLIDAAEQVLKKYVPENNVHMGTVFSYRGAAYRKLGKVEVALEYLQKAQDIYIELLNVSDIRMAYVHFHLATCDLMIGKLDKIEELYFQALAIFKQKKNYLKVIETNTNLGIFYWNTGQLKLALGAYEDAINFLPKAQKESIPLANVYNNGGLVLRDMGLYHQALEMQQKALAIRKKLEPDNYKNIVTSFVNIGLLHADKIQYEKALQYYFKALSLQTSPDRSTGVIYRNIGQVYSLLKDYQKALEYDQKAYEMELDKLSSQSPDFSLTYHNIGHNYFQLKDYEKALEYYEKALNHQDTIPYFSAIDRSHIYQSIAKLQMAQGHPKQALTSFDIVKNIRLKELGDKHRFVAEMYHAKANVFKTMGQLDKAQENNLLAIESINYGDKDSLENAFSPILLSELLIQKSEIAFVYYQETKGVIYLKQILKNFDHIQNNLNLINDDTSDPLTKQRFIDLSYRLFEKALMANHILSVQTDSLIYAKNAFLLMEKSKAFRLRERIFLNDMQQTFSIPDSLWKQEERIKYQMTQLEKETYEQSKTANHQALKDSIQAAYKAQLFDLNQALQNLKTILKTQFPQYFDLKYNNEVVDLKEVQTNMLSSDQALLTYFVGDSSIFTAVVRPDTFYFERIKKDFPLKNWVTALRTSLASPFDRLNVCQSKVDSANHLYATTAHQLYQKLIEPIEHQLIDVQSLSIIPDETLGYLPFDALLTTAPTDIKAFRTFPYLLKKYVISVSYSITLLQQMQQKKHPIPPTKNLLAFAPTFSPSSTNVISPTLANIENPVKRNQLDHLKYNISEVKAIQDLIGGDVYLAEDATEANFVEQAADYKILHLSTHALANDNIGDYAFIAFYELEDRLENEKLYNRELYGLQLKADMVVLSACETSMGELQNGEGIISLARGFAAAGAKSIITTLWSIRDDSTPDLMIDFYQNLQAGLPKDQALQQAKITYMTHTRYQSPYFWAAFVPIGDMEAIAFESGEAIWKWALGVLGVVLLFYGFSRRFS